jgi:hypothetical protein
MKNKTQRGQRSTSKAPTNSEMRLCKIERLSTRPTRRKFPLSRSPASKTSSELVAQSYQETGIGQTLARLTSLNPAKLEEMIQDLSDLRETLAPQVAATIPAGKRFSVTPEPIWEISGEARPDGRVLMIQHPGIGWLGFLIPHDDCKRLARKLTARQNENK